MSRARDTNTLRVTRGNLKEIARECSNPEAMTEILLNLPMRVALGRITNDEMEEYWRTVAPETGGCIFWSPSDTKQRHVNVKVANDHETTLIQICRVVWTATRQVLASQTCLGANEELHHLCRHNGRSATGHGACLNPGHLIRGNATTRGELRKAHAVLDKIFSAAGIKQADLAEV